MNMRIRRSIKNNLDLTPAQIEILRDSAMYGDVLFCTNTNQWKIEFKYCTTDELAKKFLDDIALFDQKADEELYAHYRNMLDRNNDGFITIAGDLFTYHISSRGGSPSGSGFVYLDPIRLEYKEDDRKIVIIDRDMYEVKMDKDNILYIIVDGEKRVLSKTEKEHIDHFVHKNNLEK